MRITALLLLLADIFPSTSASTSTTETTSTNTSFEQLLREHLPCVILGEIVFFLLIIVFILACFVHKQKRELGRSKRYFCLRDENGSSIHPESTVNNATSTRRSDNEMTELGENPHTVIRLQAGRTEDNETRNAVFASTPLQCPQNSSSVSADPSALYAVVNKTRQPGSSVRAKSSGASLQTNGARQGYTTTHYEVVNLPFDSDADGDRGSKQQPTAKLNFGLDADKRRLSCSQPAISPLSMKACTQQQDGANVYHGPTEGHEEINKSCPVISPTVAAVEQKHLLKPQVLSHSSYPSIDPLDLCDNARPRPGGEAARPKGKAARQTVAVAAGENDQIYNNLDFTGKAPQQNGARAQADFSVYDHLNGRAKNVYDEVQRDAPRIKIIDSEYSHIDL